MEARDASVDEDGHIVALPVRRNVEIAGVCEFRRPVCIVEAPAVGARDAETRAASLRENADLRSGRGIHEGRQAARALWDVSPVPGRRTT